MGVTVSFTGRQADPGLRDDAIAWAKAFAADMEWTWAPVRVERPRGFLGRQVLEVPKVEGLSLLPHFACEPVPLVFLESTGHLVDSVVLDEGDGDIRIDAEVMVKTQFGGIEVHAEVCTFLAELRERFVPDLNVDDETGFFGNQDPSFIGAAMNASWDAIIDEIGEVLEPGAELSIGGVPLRVADGGEDRRADPQHHQMLDELETWLVTRYGGFGLDFDRTRAAVEHLDLLMLEADKEGWCAEFDSEEAERLAHGMGCVFGQTVVTLLGGEWQLDQDEGLMLGQVGGVGLQMNPFQVAADRIAKGPSHGFAHHFALYEEITQRLAARSE